MNEDYYLYTKKLFGRWAPVYDVIDLFISRIREKVVTVTNAESGSKILDVCTGTGKQAFAFGKRGYDVVGIDLSEDMLNVATKKNEYDNVKFKVADATGTPFEENHFDVSCISFALHDMPIEIRERVLVEVMRVTKPKGNIVIIDYALPENKISRFLIYHFVKFYESKYYSEFIESDLEELLRKYGIKIKEAIPIIFKGAIILKGINEK